MQPYDRHGRLRPVNEGEKLLGHIGEKSVALNNSDEDIKRQILIV